MMNIFKKLFLILKSTNSKINDFENFIEKWEKDSKKDSENKMIEVEKKYKEIFPKRSILAYLGMCCFCSI